MSATATSLPPPVVPPEVHAFAVELGVSEYLPLVLDLARRLFPREAMTVRLDGLSSSSNYAPPSRPLFFGWTCDDGT
jgi:hypothetical protein